MRRIFNTLLRTSFVVLAILWLLMIYSLVAVSCPHLAKIHRDLFDSVYLGMWSPDFRGHRLQLEDDGVAHPALRRLAAAADATLSPDAPPVYVITHPTMLWTEVVSLNTGSAMVRPGNVIVHVASGLTGPTPATLGTLAHELGHVIESQHPSIEKTLWSVDGVPAPTNSELYADVYALELLHSLMQSDPQYTAQWQAATAFLLNLRQFHEDPLEPNTARPATADPDHDTWPYLTWREAHCEPRAAAPALNAAFGMNVSKRLDQCLLLRPKPTHAAPAPVSLTKALPHWLRLFDCRAWCQLIPADPNLDHLTP